MYGKYAWVAGASPVSVVADLIALVGGAAVNTLSVACNQAGSNTQGVASTWAAVDAVYGVVQSPSKVGAGYKQARITVAANIIQLAAVEGWNAGTHVATNAVAAQSCSLSTASAGSVWFLATEDHLLFASSDWTAWQGVFEVKRDGPMLSDVSVPAHAQVGPNYCYWPRLKNPTTVGFSVGGQGTLASAFGALVASAVRDVSESLYLPLVPAVTSVSSAPIGGCQALMIASGYGASGDYMIDAAANTYMLAKMSSITCAFKRV
jgi:hypothetical protein